MTIGAAPSGSPVRSVLFRCETAADDTIDRGSPASPPPWCCASPSSADRRRLAAPDADEAADDAAADRSGDEVGTLEGTDLDVTAGRRRRRSDSSSPARSTRWLTTSDSNRGAASTNCSTTPSMFLTDDRPPRLRRHRRRLRRRRPPRCPLAALPAERVRPQLAPDVEPGHLPRLRRPQCRTTRRGGASVPVDRLGAVRPRRRRPTSFSAAEQAADLRGLAASHRGLRPFDVNVTTARPGRRGPPPHGSSDRCRLRPAGGDQPDELRRRRACIGDRTARRVRLRRTTDAGVRVHRSACAVARRSPRRSSHEAGHTFGLSHDGESASPNYYDGHGVVGADHGSQHRSVDAGDPVVAGRVRRRQQLRGRPRDHRVRLTRVSGPTITAARRRRPTVVASSSTTVGHHRRDRRS